MARRKDLALAVGAAVVVLAVLTFGFRILGPPRDQRAISADERRVSDLRSMAQAIQARLAPPPLHDPVTNTLYEYHPKTGTSYELCATFATASAKDDSEYQPPSPFWHHLKGRQCFELDAAKTAPW